MPISMNTNLAGIQATRQINMSTTGLNKSFQRLSSGLRVNQASDDVSGLAVAAQMTAQIRGSNMAMKNANDSISMLQVADGALGDQMNAIQRMRELAVQASGDNVNNTDRGNLNVEFYQLMQEVDRIAKTTKYGSTSGLLQGSFANKQIQIGAYSGAIFSMTIGVGAGQGTVGASLGYDVATLSIGTSGAFAMSAITAMDYAITSLATVRAGIGAYQSRLENILSSLATTAENSEAARSRIMDADIAAETGNMARNSVLRSAGMAVLSQANQQFQSVLSLLRG